VGIDELQKALAQARSDDTADFGSPVPAEDIAAIEEYLGVKLPNSYREFVASVGWCSFGGREFYGITRKRLDATSVPSVVFATKAAREHGLPMGMLLIEDSGSEEQFVLDARELGVDSEAAVKVWTQAKTPTAPLEVVAPDFGSYLLQAATETL
jgi:hypothetical protein